MGFYVRKSLSAGPFRFNLSKSGLGVSAGVPGFRVGAGPRGNYVHMGRNGVYYRASAPKGSPARFGDQYQEHVHAPNEILMEDVSGATAFALHSTGSGDLIEQLNEAAQSRRWGWPVAIAVFIVGLATMPWGLVVWGAGIPVVWWVFNRDAARRCVILFFDVNDDVASWFEVLVASWRSLTSTANLWRELQVGHLTTTHQFKANAGASSVISRIAATANLEGPDHLRSNIAVPTISAGNASLYFLPDRVLVREGKRYSDVPYAQLIVEAGSTRFIEEAIPIPRDSAQIGETWRFVNVKGGPDRRYSNNRILPILRYGQLHFWTSGGLEWRIQTSREVAAADVKQGIQAPPMIESLP